MGVSLQVQGFTDSSIVVQIWFWTKLALCQRTHKVIHCKLNPKLTQPQASVGRCLCSKWSNLFEKKRIQKKKKPQNTTKPNACFQLSVDSWLDEILMQIFSISLTTQQQFLDISKLVIVSLLLIWAQSCHFARRNSGSTAVRQWPITFTDSWATIYSRSFF